MDVDTGNFEAALAIFEEYLPRASFVAVVLEFTGITTRPETEPHRGDVPVHQVSGPGAAALRHSAGGPVFF